MIFLSLTLALLSSFISLESSRRNWFYHFKPACAMIEIDKHSDVPGRKIDGAVRMKKRETHDTPRMPKSSNPRESKRKDRLVPRRHYPGK